MRIKQQQMSITVESLMHLEELSRKLCCGNFTGWGMQKNPELAIFRSHFPTKFSFNNISLERIAAAPLGRKRRDEPNH